MQATITLFVEKWKGAFIKVEVFIRINMVCIFFLFAFLLFNPVALRTAKTLWSFGCSGCKRVQA